MLGRGIDFHIWPPTGAFVRTTPARSMGAGRGGCRFRRGTAVLGDGRDCFFAAQKSNRLASCPRSLVACSSPMPVESRADLVSDADHVHVELAALSVDDRLDDVSVATPSVLNGGSSVAVNLADLDVEVIKPVGTRLYVLCVIM
jgi:hypothetical protein